MTPRFISSLQDIDKDQWNALSRNDYPFSRYEFLSALELSGCVSEQSGWKPRHLVVEDAQNQLIAAMPMYEKTHSYGEYVFDWQWANAFERYGRAYYPKLLTAIPFTPATGPRLLTKEPSQLAEILPTIRSAVELLSSKINASSWHLLFTDNQTTKLLQSDQQLMQRQDVQFHWQNQAADTDTKYNDFEHFLQGFRSSKRKQIKRERRKILEQGIRVIRRTGLEISDSDWAEFYACYQSTYLKRSGHTGYLNKAFFDLVSSSLAEQCMLVTAYKDEAFIASSLFFFDQTHLYGRYWGALSSHDCLHFEACYYQGIEFAIEQGLDCFDPGTQGEHKLVRGFQPTKTSSFHWVADAEFADAINRFLEQELKHTERYKDAAAEHLPFHRES